MKNKKLLNMMSLADEKYISEADPSKGPRKRKPFNWTAFLAAACCFLLILNLSIVIPVSIMNSGTDITDDITGITVNSDLNHIKNPQSSTLIPPQTDASSDSTDSSKDTSQLGTTDTSTAPSGSSGTTDSSQEGTQDDNPPTNPGSLQFIKNPELFSALDKFLKRDYNNLENESNEEMKDSLEKEESSMEDLGSSLSPDINDNQTAGVSESDIAKRSDKFLYYLSGKKLYVYSLKGTSSAVEAIFPLSTYVAQMNSYMKAVEDKYDETQDEWLEEKLDEAVSVREMFLSADFNTLTVILTNDRASMTGIYVFDVSASPTVTLKSYHMMSGSYVSSRMVNDRLLLFTRYEVCSRYNKEEPSTYVPFYVTDGEEHLTHDVYFPSVLESSSYLTVTTLSHSGAIVEESLSYLSFDDVIYVSQNNIFITRKINLTPKRDNFNLLYNTEIACINYGDGMLTHSGSAVVKGYLNNQYSLDEHEGILRVVTTSFFSEISATEDETEVDSKEEIIEDDFIIDLPNKVLNDETSASLYCIDISTMEIRARVENFAPAGEVVRSVRFEGTNAYVCTSLRQVFIDPVFFFDLSDLDNITYTQTGEFDGYSSSLINLGNGYVVGIGYGSSTSTLKIDVYREKGDEVEIVCSDTFEWTVVSHNYKSYFIDRERHLIGIGVSSRNSSTRRYEDFYLLLHFNGSYFDFILSERIEFNSSSSVRSFLQSGYLYVVTDSDFAVFQTGNLNNLTFIPEGERAPSTEDAETPNDETTPSRDLTKPAW